MCPPNIAQNVPIKTNGMIIKENNLWDGNYKKMSITSALSNTSSKIDYDAELKKGPSWTSDSGMRFIFSKNTYTLFMDNATDKGNFATGLIAGKSVLQFRSSSSSSPLASAYEMQFNTVTLPATRRRTQEKQIDYNTIILTPVKLSPNECFPIEGRSFILSRDGNAE